MGDPQTPARRASISASTRLTVFRANPNSRAIFRIEDPARQRLMNSLRLGSVMRVELPDQVFSKSGHVVSIAGQSGKGWRQHQTIAGGQASATLTVQPDLHAAQAVQHAGEAPRDAIAGQAESRVPGPSLLLP